MNIKSILQNSYYNEKLIYDVDMSKYVTFRASGNALALYMPENIDELIDIIKFLKENNINILFMGNGSNLLISSKGFDGVVLKLDKLNDYKFIKIDDNTTKLKAMAGCKVPFLANKAMKNSLSGLEFSALIPSSIGGAIYMNAGAYGGEFKDITTSVLVLDMDTLELRTFENEKCSFSYRNSFFMCDKYLILEAEFILHSGDVQSIRDIVKGNNVKRMASQPYNEPSCGSTFKRPKNDFAGRLIEDAGLKGYSIGGASVSTKHAGFIVNNNNADVDDIIELIKEVKRIVHEKTGVLLEEEVRIK